MIALWAVGLRLLSRGREGSVARSVVIKFRCWLGSILQTTPYGSLGEVG
jgi:hypothetical protein